MVSVSMFWIEKNNNNNTHKIVVFVLPLFIQFVVFWMNQIGNILSTCQGTHHQFGLSKM